MNKQTTPGTGKAPSAPAPAKPVARRKSMVARRAEFKPRVDGEMRRAMVAQAAYFRAEKRGFMLGGELDDWLEAEREVSRMLDE